MIEGFIAQWWALLLERFGVWGTLAGGVVYLAVWINGVQWGQVKVVCAEFRKIWDEGVVGVAGLCKAAWKDKAITQEEAGAIGAQLVTGFVMRPVMLVIEIAFLVIGAKAISAFISFAIAAVKRFLPRKK